MSKLRPGSKHFANLNKKRWARVRRLVFERDGYRCQKCGTAGRLECHHVVSLEDGGDPYALDNLSSYCRGCHLNHHKPHDPEADAWKDHLSKMLQSTE